MQGYWNAPASTREALVDGWLRTGDLTRVDRLGRVHLVSRKKEMIKVCGYSVFPAEVESALLAHPDVLAVAVAGVPHPVRGDVPAAWWCRIPRAASRPKRSSPSRALGLGSWVGAGLVQHAVEQALR